jgi:hypothetical protein
MIFQVMKGMIDYFHDDVRRINHALKVFNFSMLLSADEGMEPAAKETLAYASLLHDIGIKEAERKHGSTAGNFQELEGPPAAREILEKMEIDPTVIERICFLIGHHHSYSYIDGKDFQILVEADFLVNIFEDDINQAEIESIRKKIFKTFSGNALLTKMYPGRIT